MPTEDKTRLDDAGLAAALAGLDGWTHRGKAIVRTYEFDAWSDVTAFMKHLAATIEATNHHPDAFLNTTLRTCTVWVTTHSEGGVTQADVDFARRLNQPD